MKDRIVTQINDEPQQQRPRRRWPYLSWLICLAGMVVSYPYWLPMVGGYLIVADPPQAGDVLVPLAGEQSRVDDVISRLHQGVAPHMLITDMAIDQAQPNQVRYALQVKQYAVDHGVSAEVITIAEGTAQTTYQEAQILYQFAQTHQLRSLIVVTSPSHTRRARLLLREVFAHSSIHITVQPVANHWYRADTWWQSGAGWRETILEYAKLLSHQVGYQ